MWKGLCVGAVALAAMSASFAVVDASARGTGRAHAGMALRGVVVTNARIAHVKAMLKLTPAQQQQWAPLEAALRTYMRRHAGADGADSAQLAELSSAAMPLLMTLDDSQKREAQRLARSMGLQKIVALF